MLALAEIDLGTLTPEQAARQALATLEALRTENETLVGKTEVQADRRLEYLVRELQRVVYGKRSEKLSADERQLAFEDLEGAEVEAAGPPEDPAAAPKRPRAQSRPFAGTPAPDRAGNRAEEYALPLRGDGEDR